MFTWTSFQSIRRAMGGEFGVASSRVSGAAVDLAKLDFRGFRDKQVALAKEPYKDYKKATTFQAPQTQQVNTRGAALSARSNSTSVLTYL